MITEVRTVDSPCVGICNIDFDATDICQGCGRSINEIANWSVYTDEDKIVVNEQATKRMKEISFDRGF
jgi:predicted Fe-S protein YdhL (DUF1289 family)|tara:strand:+ start:369 stop:572 length:204 start_codon:yes stop_codon:yes gene_type:complete